MTELKAFKFTYTPWDREFPVRYMEYYILAKDRKEAELINLDYNWKFFSQNCTVSVTESHDVYRNDNSKDLKQRDPSQSDAE